MRKVAPQRPGPHQRPARALQVGSSARPRGAAPSTKEPRAQLGPAHPAAWEGGARPGSQAQVALREGRLRT